MKPKLTIEDKDKEKRTKMFCETCRDNYTFYTRIFFSSTRVNWRGYLLCDNCLEKLINGKVKLGCVDTGDYYKLEWKKVI